ncbi:hypothetical protein J3R83DRAFT_43, partial [Lanmaoa asiatica]
LHEQEFNPDFVKNILPRLEWRALMDAATLASIGDTSLRIEQPDMTDDKFLQKLHHVVL